MPAPEGNDFAVDNDGGAPEGNQNAQTHGLDASRDGYFADLDDNEQRWIVDMHQSLLDRYRRFNGSEPGRFDTESLKHIAIDFHRIANANGWFAEHGLVHDGDADDLRVSEWAAEIRKLNESIYERMDKHGMLPSPESQKADAISVGGRDLTVVIDGIDGTDESESE